MEQEEDLYNEEFKRYLKLAKTLIGQMKNSNGKKKMLNYPKRRKLCPLRMQTNTQH